MYNVPVLLNQYFMFETESEIRQLIIFSTLVALIFIVIIILFIVFYRSRRAIHSKEKEALTSVFENELTSAKMEIQETTLQHFTREIHDNIGQKLAVARIYINRLEAAKAASGEKSELEEISKLMGDAISDLRTIANTLNPEYITELGLIKSLQNEADRINQLQIVACRLTITGDKQDALTSQQELLLFRICQEFIQNSIKHSGCREVKIELDFGEQHFTMLLEDDGGGFNYNQVLASSSGSGLKNMLNRTKMLGGEIDIRSGNGTRLTLTLPI
jgi:two-component system, NarL family, sensor kinase